MIVPGIGPCFQFEVDNLTGTPPASRPGASFTFSGNNVAGTPVSVLSALAQDAQYLVVQSGGCPTISEDNSAIMELLFDPAGGTSWTSVAKLIAGASPTHTAGGIQLAHTYHLPLYIKAGTSVGVRAQKNGASGSTGGNVIVWAFGQPKRPEMWWCGQGIEDLAINMSTSKGVSHTPGNTGAFSAFASVGTTTKRYGALQLGVNSAGNTMSAVAYYWQLGIGGSVAPGAPTQYVSGNASEIAGRNISGPYFCDIPSGTAIQVRGTCSGTAQAWDVATYGVY